MYVRVCVRGDGVGLGGMAHPTSRGGGGGGGGGSMLDSSYLRLNMRVP